MKMLFAATLLLLTLAVTKPLYAQTSKGGWLLGGSGSVRFNDPFYLDLNPLAGYFVAKNLAVGTQVSFNIASSQRYNSRLTTIGLSPFVRYYFLNTKLRPFLKTDIGLLRTYQRYRDGIATKPIRSSEGYWNVSMGLGSVYFITPSISLQAALDYRINRFANAYSSDHHLLFSIGFGIYLSKNENE
jgi:outer membrane protein